jgi:nucleoside-diphosphate-sugar epimerase
VKIGIIGANGFIGNALVETLKSQYTVESIIKENYHLFKNINFDIIINANGNSHKHWANKNPVKDFKKSVESVYKSLYDFKYKKYIYISSIDVENIKTTYGFNKYLAEEIVKSICYDFSIIRLPAVIGKRSTKGIIYDIMNNNKIYLTKDSTLMLIDIDEFTIKLKEYIEQNKLRKLEKFYPSNNISIDEISKILNIPVNYDVNLRDEYYFYPGDYNTSVNYLKKCVKYE